MSTAQAWWITLGGGAVVVLVVAILLLAVLRSTQRIIKTLAEVWTVGQRVANNTAHLDLIRRSAVQAEEASASIELSAQYVRRLSEVRRSGVAE